MQPVIQITTIDVEIGDDNGELTVEYRYTAGDKEVCGDPSIAIDAIYVKGDPNQCDLFNVLDKAVIERAEGDILRAEED